MPLQHQIAQACHGALESGKVFNTVQCDPDSLIVIGVKNQNELLKAQKRLEENGIKTVGFWEPDWDYGWTSFGTMPLGEEHRHFLKRHQLWKP
jgi:hypothetical protein